MIVMAMAMAFASGRANGQALARYARRLETDLATISLNKTAVGFTHGTDTFGWRFYPRIQPPPTRGNLATLTDTLCGTSSTTRDLAEMVHRVGRLRRLVDHVPELAARVDVLEAQVWARYETACEFVLTMAEAVDDGR